MKVTPPRFFGLVCQCNFGLVKSILCVNTELCRFGSDAGSRSVFAFDRTAAVLCVALSDLGSRFNLKGLFDIEWRSWLFLGRKMRVRGQKTWY